MDQNVDNLLSKPWQKFLAKFEEIDATKLVKWTEVHYLAYLCRRYEQLYETKFALSFKGPPSRCTEIVFIKKMCAMLGTSNPIKIKSYIDWVFDFKIIPKQMKIRSLSFFMTPGLGNEFNLFWKEKNKIHKTTELPSEYLRAIDNAGFSLNTYGDVAFAYSILQERPDQQYQQLFNTLSSLGFDFTVLKELK